MQNYTKIHSPLFFQTDKISGAATAAETTDAADVMGATATAMEAVARAEDSTTSDFLSPNTALIFP
jgi:hypothetical protein